MSEKCAELKELEWTGKESTRGNTEFSSTDF
jgi:hypothetical protein